MSILSLGSIVSGDVEILSLGISPAETCLRFQQSCEDLLRQIRDGPFNGKDISRVENELLTWRMIEALARSVWKSGNCSSDLEMAKTLIDLFEKEAEPRTVRLCQKYSYLCEQVCDWPYTRRYVQRSRNLSNGAKDNPLFVHPDCDCLTTEDKTVDNRLFEIAFGLIRIGQRKQAVKLFEDVGQIWRFAILAGAAELGNDHSRVADQFRASICVQERTSLVCPYEIACLHILSGSGCPIWHLCAFENVWDYWWASTIQFMAFSRANKSRCSNGLSHGLCELFSDAKRESEKRLGQWTVFDIFQELLCLNSIDDCFTFLTTYLTSSLTDPLVDQLPYICKFYANAMIVLDQIHDYTSEPNRQNQFDNALSGFILVLREKAMSSLDGGDQFLCSIATYAGFIKQKQLGIDLVVETMSQIPANSTPRFANLLKNRCSFGEQALFAYSDFLRSTIIYRVIDDEPNHEISPKSESRLMFNFEILMQCPNTAAWLEYTNALIRMLVLAKRSDKDDISDFVLNLQFPSFVKTNNDPKCDCLRLEMTVLRELILTERRVKTTDPRDRESVDAVVNDVSDVLCGTMTAHGMVELSDDRRKTQVNRTLSKLTKRLLHALIELLETEYPEKLEEIVLGQVCMNERCLEIIDTETAAEMLDAVSRAHVAIMQNCELMNE